MTQWTIDDIPWHLFDPAKVSPKLLSLAKAASMVEYNGQDYARYLCEVFSDDEEFQVAAHEWAKEEVQHGLALRRWSELADPTFDFVKSFHRFTTGYQLPQGVKSSVRGSRSGELVARCMVEIGTSSYYTAIKDCTDEPVLKAICGKIAADELRHYKLFYTHLTRYLEIESIGPFKRLRVALSRIAESEDDELAYAFFAAHEEETEPYERTLYSNRYLSRAYSVYRKIHVEKMVAMMFKAVGLKPNGLLNRLASEFAWAVLRIRARFATAHA